MIMMKSPCFAFNSCDVPGINYRMRYTVNGRPGVTPAELVSRILGADQQARKLDGSQLMNVVINCHGNHLGGLAIGGIGNQHLDTSNLVSFIQLCGRNIGTIWLIACGAAQGSAGITFCQTLARISGCLVIASDADQDVGVWDTYRLAVGLPNQIDEFEGKVYSFTPRGPVTSIDPHNDVFTTLE